MNQSPNSFWRPVHSQTYRLICHQNSGLPDEEIPGCSDYSSSGNDFCIDPLDYAHLTFYPTGGWDSDFLQTKKIEITLHQGANTIRVQIPPGYRAGPNIDFMKIESSTSTPTSSPASFRNPPHFISKILYCSL